MSLSKPEHIDMQKVYTDPVYRFEYLAKFADFGQEDIDAIHASAGAVAPLVPVIVDKVYEKLFSFDVTKEVFLKRNAGFNGKLAHDLTDLTLENEQIKFRKDFLGKYLTKLVTGKYDHNFIRYLDYVGKIHVNLKGSSGKAHIDYVHCSALFGFVTSFVVDALMNAGLPHDVEKKTVLAFNKLLWIQNDFFAKWYVRDGDQYTHLSETTKTPFQKAVTPLSILVAGFAIAAAVYIKK
jgi:hypothetical protein